MRILTLCTLALAVAMPGAFINFGVYGIAAALVIGIPYVIASLVVSTINPKS
jgi:hypothetical protein